MTERDIFEKFDNLSNEELNTKSSKEQQQRGEKTEESDFEISKCSEHEVKSEIGTIFVNEKILEEYSVKIYEIDPYFYEH